MSAPFSSSSEQIAVWPFRAAQWRGVHPPYNNRETEKNREIGQGREETHRSEKRDNHRRQVRSG